MALPNSKYSCQSMRFSPEANSNLTYLDWNNKIAEYFFNPDKSGTRVWFSVEKELIDKIAQQNSVNSDSFIEAVRKGPDCINRPRQTICSKASAIHEHWQNNKSQFEYPPYIAYLALFVLAVNHGDSDDFSENDYYGRLKDMVNENLTTTYFKKTADLWDDLENWTLKDKKSSVGEFYNDTVGNNFYVGIPQYQVVLKTEDKKNLRDIFWKMDWDSDSNPTEQEILQALKNYQRSLSSRTSKRIEKGKPEFLSILTDRVLEELRDYDENERLTEDKGEVPTKRGTIEICLDIDKTVQTTDFFFRCKRKSGLPEEKFTLKHNNSEWEVAPSSSILSQKIENFNIDNWEKDFSTESGKYKFHYKGEKYKIFTSAAQLDARGWISGQRPLPGKHFYLVAHDSLANKIQKWGRTECDSFCPLDFNGLPREWCLFEIKGVNGDKGIRQDIPALAIDKKLRIRFEGGIRLKQGNQFFGFAPPKISITGGAGKAPIPVYQIDNQEEISLVRAPEEVNIFSLPDSTLCEENEENEENIKIQIKSTNSECKTQKNLKLVKNRLRKFHDYSNQQGMNYFGGFISLKNPDESDVSKAEYFTGSYCHGFKSNSNYPKLPQISFEKYKKIYLIGSIPGQIIVWPEHSWPESWPPVWMIQFKSYKKALACLIGNIKEIQNGEQSFSTEQIKLWKKVVWHGRKKVKSKSKKQWKLWTKRAKNV